MSSSGDEFQDSKAVEEFVEGISELLGRWRKGRRLDPKQVVASLRARGFKIGLSDITRYENAGPDGYKHRSLKMVLGMMGLYGKSMQDLADGLLARRTGAVSDAYFEPLRGDPVRAANRLAEIEMTTQVGNMCGRQFPKRRTPPYVRSVIKEYRSQQVARDITMRWNDDNDDRFLGFVQNQICLGYDTFADSVSKLDQATGRPRGQVLNSFIDDWDTLRIAAGLDEYGLVSVDATISFFDAVAHDVCHRDDQPAHITDQSLHSALARLSLSQFGGLTLWDDALLVRRHLTMPMNLQFIDQRDIIEESQQLFVELDRAAGGADSRKLTLKKIATLKFLTERRNQLQEAIFARTDKKGARPLDGPQKSPQGIILTIAQAAKAVGIRGGRE